MNAKDIIRPTAHDALGIVAEDLARLRALLGGLDPADWERPTDCVGWSVHDVVAHVVGQCEEMARPDRLVRRVRRARRMPGGGVLDARNQCQVEERADASPQQLLADLDLWGTKAVRAAGRIPAPLRRRMRLSLFFPEARRLTEDSFDFLIRVIMARDTWMHRVDIATATGRPLALDQHDAEIVRQVVGDLAALWTGPPLILDLTGPAGGRWSLDGTSDDRAPATVRCDAITYLRLASGRPADPPTIDGDPHAAAALLATRVEF